MRTVPVQPEAHSAPLAIDTGKQASPRERFAHPWRRSLPLVGLTLLIVLVGILALGPFQHAFARGLSFNTCHNALPQEKAALCDGADPIGGACAFDASTVEMQPILLGGKRVGLAQVRYSPSCNTYWGRGFSFVPGATLTVYLPVLGTGDTASFLTQSPSIYSNMFYDPVNGQFPTVVIGVILEPRAVAQVTIQGVG